MLHLFTHYIYRKGQESCMDSWICSHNHPSLPFIKLFDDTGGTADEETVRA